jgi:hypothetical protein
LTAEVFNDVMATAANTMGTEAVGTNLTGFDDPRYSFQPPFNKISRERDPGRVNLNTVTGRRTQPTTAAPIPSIWSEVFDGLMHRVRDNHSTEQLGHFGPAWRDVVISRRGYAQVDAMGTSVDKPVAIPDAFAFGLNSNFPSVFSNPFRSPDAGDLVPLPQMVRPGIEAARQRGHHYIRAREVEPGATAGTFVKPLLDHPFRRQTLHYDNIHWGIAGFDDNGNGLVDEAAEAGFGAIPNLPDLQLAALTTKLPPNQEGDHLSFDPASGRLLASGIPLFSETFGSQLLSPTNPPTISGPFVDGERNAPMMYQPMTRLENLTTNRSNVFAIWITVGYFEVEKAPDWNDPNTTERTKIRARFGGTLNDADAATQAALALYNRVYPDGYMLGKEIGSDTGDTKRHRGFYIFDRSEEVGFKPGEDLNVENAIRLRRRIE